MEINLKYALHETLEVQEIVAFKTVCMTKSLTMQALVTDPELLSLLSNDVKVTTQQLQELGGILSKSQQGS